MKSTEYLDQILKFENKDFSKISDRFKDKGNVRLLHAQMGISGEAGEICELIKKHFMYSKPLDINKVEEECGDLLFYMSVLLNEVGSSFEEVMKGNFKKLSKRYGNGFSEEKAKLRLDK